MSITPQQVKELREKTGAGMLDVKNALEAVNGDMDKAAEYLRQKGILSSERRVDKMAKEGMISSYIHNNKIGVLVEVNCETDFVAKTLEFQQLVKDICLQIASSAPLYINKTDIPQEALDEESRIEMGKEDLASKPEHMRVKIVQGRVDKLMKQRVLMEQPFIKDPSKTIAILVKETIGVLKENIVVKRFVRYTLGETL